MAEVDYKALKKGGFMKQIHKDMFSMRIKAVGGQISAVQLYKLKEVAEQYAQGYVHLTSRQGVEIPFIRLGDIDAVKRELAEVGLQPGACGPRVRTITACQGAAICPSGLIDTMSLAREFDQRYGGREVPHKFKLGITGCRNNCLKAEENDLGVKGGVLPAWEESQCTFCGLCEAVCPTEAIHIQKEKEALSFTETACVYCGRCIKSCPVNAWTGRSGFLVSFGGLFGNRISIGKQLTPIIFDTDKLYDIVETTLQFFAKHGKAGERFGNTLERVGWEPLRQELAAII